MKSQPTLTATCVAFLLLILGCAGSPAQITLTAKLDQAITGELAKGFSGAVLVAKGDQIVLEQGYGSEQGVKMQADSRFWIASMGKQFTSAAILKCAERGLLDLDETIVRFFPEVPADKRAITIKQLLAHLSGLPQSYVSEEKSNQAEAVRAILAEPLIDQPGQAFHYSNNNYQLAVAIVEIASGSAYRDFLQREFFDLLELNNTGFNGTDGAQSVVPARNETPVRLQKPSWGGQGEYSNVRDLFRWYRALRQGNSVLSASSVRILFTPVTPIQEGAAALGWFTGKSASGKPHFFTRGNEDWGPNALLYAYPDADLVIVVLTHAGDFEQDSSWSRVLQAKLAGLALGE